MNRRHRLLRRRDERQLPESSNHAAAGSGTGVVEKLETSCGLEAPPRVELDGQQVATDNPFRTRQTPRMARIIRNTLIIVQHDNLYFTQHDNLYFAQLNTLTLTHLPW